ncbi:MAG: hypothetical protein AB7U98_09615 [Candidatus Nitrosocosmicus sp.]
MNKSVRIIVIAIAAGILAFAVFQIAMYVWADNMFNKMFGGHLYSDYDNKVQQIKELQKKNEALLDEFNSR